MPPIEDDGDDGDCVEYETGKMAVAIYIKGGV